MSRTARQSASPTRCSPAPGVAWAEPVVIACTRSTSPAAGSWPAPTGAGYDAGGRVSPSRRPPASEVRGILVSGRNAASPRLSSPSSSGAMYGGKMPPPPTLRHGRISTAATRASGAARPALACGPGGPATGHPWRPGGGRLDTSRPRVQQPLGERALVRQPRPGLPPPLCGSGGASGAPQPDSDHPQ
jgi:hypothetical protein